VGNESPPDITKLYGTSLKKLTVTQRYNRPPRGVILGQFLLNKKIPKGCQLSVSDVLGGTPLVTRKA
jgi:hypothetical protein